MGKNLLTDFVTEDNRAGAFAVLNRCLNHNWDSDNYELNMRHDWNSLLTRRPAPSMLFRNFDKEYFPAADSLVSYLRHILWHSQNLAIGAHVDGSRVKVDRVTCVRQ